MARLALPGRSLIEANQSLTCSAVTASTVRWPKAGRMSLRTMSVLVRTVAGFQCRAWRSRNSAAKATIGRSGVLGAPSFFNEWVKAAMSLRASRRASGTVMASASPRVA